MAYYNFEQFTADDQELADMMRYSFMFTSIVGDLEQPAVELPSIFHLWEEYGWDIRYLKGEDVPGSAIAYPYAEYVYFFHEEDSGKLTKSPAVNVFFKAICPKCERDNEIVTTVDPALKHEDVKLERYRFKFECHPAPPYIVRFFTPLVIDPQNIQYPGVVAATKRFAGRVGNGVRELAGKLRRNPNDTSIPELPDWSGEGFTGDTVDLSKLRRK